jgi:glyoxylase-like metal-dependent hydrolase (beta-lactamase superfamily II)
MLKIYHLNCAEIESPVGRAIGHCLLLETEDRLILIDTGIGLTDTLHPNERIGKELIDIIGICFNEEWTAIRQIERLGLNPKNVTDCIISHLDNDHIGGLADFPNAIVHVGIEEYNNFESGNPRYVKAPLSHNPPIKTYKPSTDSWHGFEARRIDIGLDTEIFLIPLFGHTYGHCGIAIKYMGKWLFYVGDAYYYKIELKETDHPVNELAKMRADDNNLRIETLHKIRSLVAEHPEIEVFGYHDFEEYK